MIFWCVFWFLIGFVLGAVSLALFCMIKVKDFMDEEMDDDYEYL